ncbi:MAG: FAD-dependent oxidoreductase [Paracraurococcus sp.]
MTSHRRDLLLTSAALTLAPAAAALAATVTPLDRAAQVAGAVTSSLDFANKRYTGPAGSVADPVAARLLIVSRNAPGYAQTLAGTWTQFAANVLRVTDRGALIERAATNYAQSGSLGAGTTLPGGWSVAGKPSAVTMTVGKPVTDADTGFTALPVTFSGSNNFSFQTRVEVHFVSRTQINTKAGDIWVGSAFVALKAGTLPSNARMLIQAADSTGNVPAGGTTAGTPAAYGTDYAAEGLMPTTQTVLQRLETTTFTVGSGGSCMQAAFAFDLAVGAAVNCTLHIAMPQLEKVPDTEARATSPIVNFDTTGTGTSRPADQVILTGRLLAAVATGQGTIAATLAGTPWRPAYGTSSAMRRLLSSVVPRRPQVILGVNTQIALQREADGGVSSALGGKPRTFRTQITNWANAQTAILTWGGGKTGLCSTACANHATRSGAFPTVTSVQLGSGGGGSLDGYLQKITFGPAYVANLAAIGNIDTEVVVYGAKPGGICAAYRAASEGRKVAILGDWREVQVGGMMAGGLGQTDVVNATAYGGLGRYVITRINKLMGPNNGTAIINDTSFYFQPRFASAAFDELLARAGVNVYWTSGVTAVPKTGTRITSLVCGNTKTYGTQALTPKTATGKVFIGSDYEGDIMPLAGISWIMGREAASTYKEVNSGYMGIYPPASVNNFMFPDSAGNAYILTVDPWITPGNPASGPIKGVIQPPALSVGAADPTGNQAFNFRVIMTQVAARRIALPSKAPAGFDASEYELFLRFLAAVTATGRTYQANNGQIASTTNKLFCIHDLLTLNFINEVFDINARAGVSSDYIGKSADYVRGDYATRERVWQAHISWFLGLWYVMQYHVDSRVPAALRADALTYGLDALHYPNFHPNDFANWSPQLYVREARRMVGDFVWHLGDVVVADGTTPRSPRTIAAGSYTVDSHAFYRLPWNNGGKWTCWNEGSMGYFAGSTITNNGVTAPVAGADKIAPLPLDAFLPKNAECSNYAATFAGSVSHSAFGFFRMELANAAVGEGIGLLAAMACEQTTQPDLQAMLTNTAGNFSYGTLRYRLTGSNDVPGTPTITPAPIPPSIALGGKAPVAPLKN